MCYCMGLHRGTILDAFRAVIFPQGSGYQTFAKAVILAALRISEVGTGKPSCIVGQSGGLMGTFGARVRVGRESLQRRAARWRMRLQVPVPVVTRHVHREHVRQSPIKALGKTIRFWAVTSSHLVANRARAN